MARAPVEERGMEMLALDQTVPDPGLPVVEVVVPGSHHLWWQLTAAGYTTCPPSSAWCPNRPRPDSNPRLNPTAGTIQAHLPRHRPRR